jgi:ABC-2 type transport system ATP-binding protein
MQQSPAVLTQGLTKSYSDVQALRGVDLEVRRGEIFGFLGPNGSGKTTTIRCLLDLIRPSGGRLRVLGLDPQAQPVAVRARVGYLPGELRFDDNLTAEGVLRLAAPRSEVYGRESTPGRPSPGDRPANPAPETPRPGTAHHTLC